MTSASIKAQHLLDDLAANGGKIIPKPLEADGLPRFLLDVEGGGDRTRCRDIVADLRADGQVLRAALVLLSTRSAA